MLVRQSACTEDWVAKLSLGLSFSCCFPVVAKYVEISCLYVIVVKQILIWWLIGVKKISIMSKYYWVWVNQHTCKIVNID